MFSRFAALTTRWRYVLPLVVTIHLRATTLENYYKARIEAI
jgi:hypothetical protein